MPFDGLSPIVCKRAWIFSTGTSIYLSLQSPSPRLEMSTFTVLVLVHERHVSITHTPHSMTFTLFIVPQSP